MGDCQPPQGDKGLKLVTISLGLLGLLLLLGVAAAATATADSCSQANAALATGTVYVVVRWTGNAPHGPAGVGCADGGGAGITDSNFVGLNAPAGSPLTLDCRQATSGTVPPSLPTSITISVYADNSNLGGGGTPIWTDSVGSCSGSVNVTTFNHAFTSTGAVGGTPRAGIYRIFIRIQNTGVGTSYDCNSDETGSQTPPTGGSCNSGALTHFQGVMRANPGISAANLTSGGGAFHDYIGGDTLTTSLTSNATEVTTATRTASLAASGTGDYHQFSTSYNLAVGATTKSNTIQGLPGFWPNGAISLKWTETGGSTLAGYTGLSFWIFTSATVSGATVVNANTITFDPTDNLNRTITPTGTCVATVSGTATEIVNRGQTVHVAGCKPWIDARGGSVTNNQPARGWMERSYRSSADFATFSGLFGAQSDFETDNTASTSATVTTGKPYTKMVETFVSTGRADSELLNWGNTTGLLDVSATYRFDSLNIATSSDGTNQSAFTIGTDVEFLHPGPLRDGATNPLSGIAVTCVRKNPTGGTESTTSMGNTGVNGRAPEQTFQTIAPAGTWTFDCSASSNGNTALYHIAFFHVSAFTANTDISTSWKTVLLPNGSYLVNVTSVIRTYDPTQDQSVLEFADDAVRLTVFNWSAPNQNFLSTIVQRGIMMQLDTDSAYSFTFYASQEQLQPAYAYVTANITGRTFTNGNGFYQQLSTSSGATGNFLGNFTGNFTIISGVNGMIETAFDAWIPLVIWGGLCIIFAYFTAWIPLTGALIAVADGIIQFQFGVGLIGTPGSTMIFISSLVVHTIVMNGVWPKPFSRREGKD